MFEKGVKVIVPLGFYQAEGVIKKTVKRDYEDPIFLVAVEGDEIWLEMDNIKYANGK